MNVLTIGLDRALFNLDSDTRIRVRQYASWVDKYVVIVTTLKSEGKRPFTDGKLEVIPTNSISKIFYPLDILAIAWKNRRYKFDLQTAQDPFICAIAGILIKLFLKIPLNIQIHSEFFNSRYFREESFFNRVLYYTGLFTLRFADTVRARNNRIKKDVIHRFPKLSGKVGYIGVRINEVYFLPLSSKKRDPNLVVSVGRFAKQKNYPLLLRAMVRVIREIPSVRLVIVSGGDERQALGNLINKLGLQESVELKEWMLPEELVKLYDQASLFVIPSNHEGWGLVVLEAFARGLPVVMTDTGCAGEIVINSKTGYVVSIGKQKELEEAIIFSLANSSESFKMALNGRKLAGKDCDPFNIKNQMLGLFEKTALCKKN